MSSTPQAAHLWHNQLLLVALLLLCLWSGRSDAVEPAPLGVCKQAGQWRATAQLCVGKVFSRCKAAQVSVCARKDLHKGGKHIGSGFEVRTSVFAAAMPTDIF